MLDSFDWVRRSRSGAELLATMEYLEEKPDLFFTEEIGSPHSALSGPCQRCWIYPRQPASSQRSPRNEEQETSPDPYHDRKAAPYCEPCRTILARASRLGKISRQSVAIWGWVNQLPKQLETGEGFHPSVSSKVGKAVDRHVLAAYVHGQNHFLLMMRRYTLKPWLQELLLYHGAELKGVIQVLPTTSTGGGVDMADVLGRAVHQEARFSMDQLRVRFFSAPYQLLKPHTRDREGLLTFEVSEFLSLLEMAAVFRTILRPEAQQALHELLTLDDPSEEQFYWGRFLGYLNQEAKDMLTAWRIRQWPKARIQLLYELTNYVAFYQTD